MLPFLPSVVLSKPTPEALPSPFRRDSNAASATSIPPAAASGRSSATYSRKHSSLRTGSTRARMCGPASINKFISIGGDLRTEALITKQPGTTVADSFDLRTVPHLRKRQRRPQSPDCLCGRAGSTGVSSSNREAYGLYWSASHEWYVKAGQMYLPFGFRLQDQSAFVQQITGINMTTPDQGVELGYEHGHWDAQLAISNGTAGGPEVDHGKQFSSQLIYVENMWRLGLAARTSTTKPKHARQQVGRRACSPA